MLEWKLCSKEKGKVQVSRNYEIHIKLRPVHTEALRYLFTTLQIHIEMYKQASCHVKTACVYTCMCVCACVCVLHFRNTKLYVDVCVLSACFFIFLALKLQQKASLCKSALKNIFPTPPTTATATNALTKFGFCVHFLGKFFILLCVFWNCNWMIVLMSFE